MQATVIELTTGQQRRSMSVSRQERGSQMSRWEHTSHTEQTVAQPGGTPLPLSRLTFIAHDGWRVVALSAVTCIQ